MAVHEHVQRPHRVQGRRRDDGPRHDDGRRDGRGGGNVFHEDECVDHLYMRVLKLLGSSVVNAGVEINFGKQQ